MKTDWLTELDEEVIRITGYGARRGYGHHPALIVIDAQKKAVGIDAPILESMKIYPISIGEKACRAVKKIKELQELARVKNIPVLYSTSGVPKSHSTFGSFTRKRIPHELITDPPKDYNEIVETLKPKQDQNEWVFHKYYASAFFGTPLISFLNTLQIDTLIVTGFVTSGCVRAFAVDAASYNFNTVVIEDCVADRFEFAHNLSLLDLNLKYADVVSSTDAKQYMDSF